MAVKKEEEIQKVFENTTIENVKILGGQFKNFSGRKTKFDATGKRVCSIALDNQPPELVKHLTDLGYNIKYLKPREEGGVEVPFLTLGINCPGDNPDLNPRLLSQIFVVTSRGKTQQDSNTIGILDGAEIVNADVVIRPYNWKMPNGMHGVKAYVKSMYITIQEDDLARKYS